jgi:hypothetical protein
MQQTPHAGGSYRREKDGTLTPIGKSQPKALQAPAPADGQTTPAEAAPKKGK